MVAEAQFLSLLSRVQSLMERGDTTAARGEMLKSPFDKQPGWHHVLARLCIELDDVESAVRHAIRAVSLAPHNPHYRAQLAVAFYLAAKSLIAESVPFALEAAEIEAEHALSLDPNTPTAANTLGLVRAAQRNLALCAVP